MPLEEVYYEINQILGNNAEPLESVLLVEEYRRYWKPKTVRVVLLAESHVFTSDEDRRIVIPPIDDLPGYPKQYARFVYCLGNGERDLTNDPHHPLRDGTPQFWKVLYACNNRIGNLEDFRPVQRGTSFPQRLQNKIHLLKSLRSKGIWLVDASIVAVYGKGVNVSRRSRTEVLRESWRSYTRQVVTSANPEHVICVGKGVAGIVEKDLRAPFPNRFTVIPQPNARLSSKEHMANFRRDYEICNL
ncbi:MAG: hypothetical protein A2Z40_05360 [Deltaproteobacteria bacterium RBG_19FT_COMBO_60_16]|nr:MAG: hypothetical protein A2Z40_05360 [Deltaproteobacteria bacterium RBG_19FT_COMBO_60_16]